MYISRNIEKVIAEHLKFFPVVGITGPRQSGKSTTLKKMLPHYTYVSFDDFKIRSFFYDDPEGFFKKYHSQVVFDEVQKVPEIFEYIKISVDNDRQNYGKFVLTGSSQFVLMKKITESLAGRIGLLSMLPLAQSELPQNIGEHAVFKGSYPEIVLRSYEGSALWYSSYINTYLEKDVRDLISLGDLRDFQRFLQLLAAQATQVLNMSYYATEIGVSVQTIKRWVSVLEASYIIFLLPPFSKNIGKRVIKSPKVYFYDTGLVGYLTGVSDQESFEKGPMLGSLFENYIVAEIIKKQSLEPEKNHMIYFLRTSSQEEIDVIIDRKSHYDCIEIKHSSTFKTKMFDTIKKYLQEGDRGFIVYNGEDFEVSSSLKAINYKNYL